MTNIITVFEFDAGGYYCESEVSSADTKSAFVIVDSVTEATDFGDERPEFIKYLAGNFETFELVKADK